MRFDFSGMVSDGVALSVNHQGENQSFVVDDTGKKYLQMTHQGDVSHNPSFIEHVVTNYVQFSGMNFPHIMGAING